MYRVVKREILSHTCVYTQHSYLGSVLLAACHVCCTQGELAVMWASPTPFFGPVVIHKFTLTKPGGYTIPASFPVLPIFCSSVDILRFRVFTECKPKNKNEGDLGTWQGALDTKPAKNRATTFVMVVQLFSFLSTLHPLCGQSYPVGRGRRAASCSVLDGNEYGF